MVQKNTIYSKWPEIPLVLIAFFLNFFWEMVQSPLYDDIRRRTYNEILATRLHCTLGDVSILLVSFWMVGWFAGNRHWLIGFRGWDVTAFMLLGLGYTVASEWINVDIRSAWGYGSAMPQIPFLGTGVAPFAQWLLLPPLIAGVTRRFLDLEISRDD